MTTMYTLNKIGAESWNDALDAYLYYKQEFPDNSWGDWYDMVSELKPVQGNTLPELTSLIEEFDTITVHDNGVTCANSMCNGTTMIPDDNVFGAANENVIGMTEEEVIKLFNELIKSLKLKDEGDTIN